MPELTSLRQGYGGPPKRSERGSLTRRRKFRPTLVQRLVERMRSGEREGRDDGVKRLPRRRDHLIAAMHGTHRCFEDRARSVLVAFARAHRGLFADHAIATYFANLAIASAMLNAFYGIREGKLTYGEVYLDVLEGKSNPVRREGER